MTERRAGMVPPRATGSLPRGHQVLPGADSFAGLQDPATRRALRQLASRAVPRRGTCGVLAEFNAQRGRPCVALPRGVSQRDHRSHGDLAADRLLAEGVLLRTALLSPRVRSDAGAAADLAVHLIAAGRPREGQAVQGDRTARPRIGVRC